MERQDIKREVRKRYAGAATRSAACCGTAEPCCAGAAEADEFGKIIGYTDEELGSVPEGSNLGLGCGNPVALASLREGEVVLDLGSGAGFDCFLAARRVGKSGKVIGVDMTPEMIEKARENARKAGFENVEFRLGEIETLPAGDNTADAVISNCVINLSPEKERVFAEAFRVLKPGGRLMVSDIVLLRELPESVKSNPRIYTACLGGAVMMDEYLRMIKEAGFRDVEIREKSAFPLFSDLSVEATAKELNLSRNDIEKLEDSFASIRASAVKPARSGRSV